VDNYFRGRHVTDDNIIWRMRVKGWITFRKRVKNVVTSKGIQVWIECKYVK